MKTSLPRQAIQCIAALSVCLAIQASADVQLLPAGEFAGRDGRPGPGKTWKLNDAHPRTHTLGALSHDCSR